MAVRLAAHRENWLLAVFHLWRRGDPEGRSSITAAVFISCFTQSSWCWRVCGGRGRCYSTLTLMCGCLRGFSFIYYFCPCFQRCKPTKVCNHMGATFRRPPFLTQLNIPLSLAHRHRPRLNLSRDCAADIYGSVGFGKKKIQLMFLLPSEHDAPQPALADCITFFLPSSSSSHFPLFAHRTQSRSFCTLHHLSLEIFFFFFWRGSFFLRAIGRCRAFAIITHSLSAELDLPAACEIPA